MIFSPDIFLLDDPTSSLDNKVTSKIMEIIKTEEFWSEKTFILSTNNPRLLDSCKRVIFIENGVITYNGDTEGFKNMHQYQEMILQQEQEEKKNRNIEVSKTTIERNFEIT